jgi:pilus assembly protein CpaB
MRLPPGSKHFILAGVVGIAAVFLVHSYISKRIFRPIVRTGQVVVAEADITPGTALSGRLVRVASWPGDIIPSKALASTKEVEGRVCQSMIAKGEPILLTKLAPEGTAAGLGGLLAPDRLAVTVKTDEVSGVAGFISPGDRVDVLAEVLTPGEGGEHQSKLILQNLKVLSKGQIWD